MEDEILGFIMTQGAWATLFVALLFYVLKTNETRESKYLQLLDELSKQFKIMESVKQDVCDIKSMLK